MGGFAFGHIKHPLCVFFCMYMVQSLRMEALIVTGNIISTLSQKICKDWATVKFICYTHGFISY